MGADHDAAVGQHFWSTPRAMTRERMRWYCDALETAALANGEFVIAEPTIHTDEEYAKEQGLPGIIADGMLSTNYISSLLYQQFGERYLAGGELRTKFIRPVYEDDVIQAHGRVTGLEDGRWSIEVWCQTANEQKVTVGVASVPVA
ncbi:MaoC family dehydratase [Actinopolymorpha alba]|uniref:MaoC family dehydratase n=1 Tax=Actinopolymorpha alba TaxID=533267 RepID=UPI00037A1C7F|nr:MaoC family dehydratase [Actinopolymorpha alba]